MQHGHFFSSNFLSSCEETLIAEVSKQLSYWRVALQLNNRTSRYRSAALDKTQRVDIFCLTLKMPTHHRRTTST